MASGVGVNSACLEEFTNLKLRKKTDNGEILKYIVYNLNKDNTEIVVEKTSASGDYEEFLGDLPEGECRWAVYDFEFQKEGGIRNKLCFFMWSPDKAKIKQKMLFASSKDALRRALVGIAVEVQGTDIDEVAYESVLEKASKGN
ncbi:cofilin [Stygiomarasmius scandens]|uniref:Cofilin n=1 Tax=Marasmiellus scandens TaxID=2682957 RepID=A0ABR1JXL0_9AGAR